MGNRGSADILDEGGGFGGGEPSSFTLRALGFQDWVEGGYSAVSGATGKSGGPLR